ncbi:ROK family protein [Ponticaulis sp.]|uniref:ROK family protein n=1 Tax=Ponticaulis sp. TaxID=2020902 RepID=UPI000E84C9E8|nr:ROK family protein [Ponticaulis sp.]HBH89883.1 hypothetical protein [Hyphomonadaceae bacterium]|tara:strand:+ start:1338 stop:2597 length:1260 start_codon:yes stop_codon:yes gene_type:complete
MLEEYNCIVSDEVDPIECDLGSIVLTKDSIFIGWGVGEGRPDYEKRPSQVKLVGRCELKGGEVDGDRLIMGEPELHHAIDILLQRAPNIAYLCVSGAGPFRLLGKRYRDDTRTSSNYGQIISSTTQPRWSKHSLYTSALNGVSKSKFGRKASEVTVLVALDVNTAALGEHYYMLDQSFDGTELEYQLTRALRTTAYVKISNSVNVGFISNGWMNRGRGHSQMSVFRPRKSRRINGQVIIDRFEGICKRHGDCIEGLVCIDALSKRLLKSGYSVPASGASIKDLYEATGTIEAPVWLWSAFYVSQLIQVTTAMVSPLRVSLGGVLATGPDQKYDAGWSEFIDLIKLYFEAELWSDVSNENPISPSPYFREVIQPDFISYRSCAYPSVLGGLIAARWDKTNYYPSPVQYMFEQQKRNVIPT